MLPNFNRPLVPENTGLRFYETFITGTGDEFRRLSDALNEARAIQNESRRTAYELSASPLGPSLNCNDRPVRFSLFPEGLGTRGGVLSSPLF